jgi:aldehyde dehydrogenase (NAD+)
VGDPQGDFVMGPVVSGAQFEKIQALIQKGIDEGATPVAGGTGRPDGLEKGYYVKPTVFARVTNDMTVAREEIFGPVVTILGYDSVDHAVEIANDTEYGLAGYVAGADLEKARAVARRIRADGSRSTTPSTSAVRSAGTRRAATGGSGASSASTTIWRPREFSARG